MTKMTNGLMNNEIIEKLTKFKKSKKPVVNFACDDLIIKNHFVECRDRQPQSKQN